MCLGTHLRERIKLQEEELFAVRDPEIAAAPNKAARKRMIDKLPQTNPALGEAFEAAKHGAPSARAMASSGLPGASHHRGRRRQYLRPLRGARTGVLAGARGRAGIVVPTNIATDDTTKTFFGDVVEKQALASLYDFENREKLFPAVDSRYKLCLLTLSATPSRRCSPSRHAGRAPTRRAPPLSTLTPEEIALFNPNTRTMPSSTRVDVELTRKIWSARASARQRAHRGEPVGREVLADVRHVQRQRPLRHRAPRGLRAVV